MPYNAKINSLECEDSNDVYDAGVRIYIKNEIKEIKLSWGK